jgi:hypothetical protein
VVPSAQVASGMQQDDWVILTLDGGATLYLQRVRGGALELRAARRDNWQIEYADWQSGLPRTVRIVSTGAPAVDLRAQLSQLETNVDLEESAFTVDVPREAQPITLDELREAGPLRGAPSSNEPRNRGDAEPF